MYSEKEILKNRVESRRKELESKLEKLKANSKSDGNAIAQKIRDDLSDLQGQLKEGWDNLTEDVAGQLNKWLDNTDSRSS
ncbi:MAG: hypothetical protein EP343_25935 [Deltaproteobacteria bacterium]|nr:MAG: hypothetical protein EP343_25935 [Deltaproteobacteria bacterium]